MFHRSLAAECSLVPGCPILIGCPSRRFVTHPQHGRGTKLVLPIYGADVQAHENRGSRDTADQRRSVIEVEGKNDAKTGVADVTRRNVEFGGQ
jgi:hypothetical protein